MVTMTSSAKASRSMSGAVHLRERAQAERVLDPRRSHLRVDQLPHRAGDPARTREGCRDLDRRAEGFGVAAHGREVHGRDDHGAPCESRSRSATASAASARTAALLDMNVSASPGAELDRAGHRRRAGHLAAQHQRGGRERCEVARADAPTLAHRGQRVGREHRRERVEHLGTDPVAVGGQLVEAHQQHRAHALGRSAARRSWWRASAAAAGPGSPGRAGPWSAVGADTGRATVDRPVLGDVVGERVRRSDPVAGRRQRPGPVRARRETATMSSSVR